MLLPTPAPQGLPAPSSTLFPQSPKLHVVQTNPYIMGASGLDMSLGLPDLQTRAAEQQRLMQMAQLSSMGLAPATDPHTWTPAEAAQQTDNAIAKISTVDPAAAQRLAEQRAPGQDSGGGFWDSLKHIAGDILHPGLELGGRILDIVARTASIVPNIAFDAVNGGDFKFFNDVGGALSGEVRHNWNSVMQEMGMTGDGIGGFLRATFGMGLDIVTDPLTWLIPAGAAEKAAEGAAHLGETVATRATSIVDRAAAMGSDLVGEGTNVTDKLTSAYRQFIGQAEKAGWKSGGEHEDIITGLLAQEANDQMRGLLGDMYTVSSKVFDVARDRSFSTWIHNGGSVILSDGSKLAGKDMRTLVEKAISEGNLSGKAIGSASAEWKTARSLASAMGGTRLKLNLPFTSLRYISPALPGSKFITEKTIGMMTRMVAGQSGMNRMIAAIGKGEAEWSDLRTWMEEGFNKAFDKNPDMVKNLRGRFKNGGSMFYSMSEAMGGISSFMDSGARATRTGLAGYVAHAQAIEAQNVYNHLIREVAYATPDKAGKKMDRQTFLRQVESTLGLSFRKKGQTATTQQMRDYAVFLDAFPQGLNTSDAAEIEKMFWAQPRNQGIRLREAGAEQVPGFSSPGASELQAAEARLADLQETVTRLPQAQRDLLDHMQEMWHSVRGEAAKRDTMLADVRQNFERAGVLVPKQADEWALGTHPVLQQDFWIDPLDAGRHNRIQYNGVSEADVADHGGVTGIHATRTAGGGRGISGQTRQVRARIRGADWVIIDETKGAVASDESLLLTARANAEEAVAKTSAAASEQVPEASLPVLAEKTAERQTSDMSTAEIRALRPDASGVVYKRANGDIEVTVFDPKDIKVVSDNAAHLVPSERGYFRRTLTKDAKEWLRGKVPREGREVLIAEPEIAAYLSRQTLGMDIQEAEQFIRGYLADTYGATGLPDQIWNFNPLEVHEEYLASVGGAVQAEMLGKAARRMTTLGELAPAMFGSSPRSQKYDWMLHPSLLSNLAKKDAKLTRAILASHEADAKRMEGQHAILSQASDDFGMFRSMVEESLANGVEVPSRYVQAVRKYGSTRAEAQARITAELDGIGSAETTLREHVAAYDAATEHLADDPAYGHPGSGKPMQVINNPDGTQTVRGWHYTQNRGLTPGTVRGIDMSSNGFHMGDFDTAYGYAGVDLGNQGKTVGWRRDPSSWPTRTEHSGGLPGDPEQYGGVDAYDRASAEAGVPVVETVVPVEPDVFYDDVLFPVEATGQFAGALPGEVPLKEGSVEQGKLGATFTGSGHGETVQKAIDRGQLQSKGKTGALYTNAVEGTGGNVSLVVLEPGDVIISRPTERFAKDVADGKLYRQADGTVSARRTAGSRKLMARADATDQLTELSGRRAELENLNQSLSHGNADFEMPVPHEGPLAKSGRVGGGGQLIFRGERKVKRTGQDDGTQVWWKSVFGSHTEDVARQYAGDDGTVERILLKPEAKVLVEDSPEFKAMMPEWYRTEYVPGSILPGAEHGAAAELDKLTLRAKKAGFDAIQMKDQAGHGTAILNEDAVVRAYRRDPLTRTVGDVAAAGTSVARTGTAAAEALGKRQLAAGKRLAALNRRTHNAMNEANKAYAEFHGARAALQPALVKVETAGNLKGLTRLRVPGLEGYAMPDYIAAEFHHAIDQYGATGLQKAWREHVMGPWKRWATYRWPGFHIRNFFGAFFNNWLGGVTLEDYVFSWRVNHARDGSLKWAAREVDKATMDRMHLGFYFGKKTPTYQDVADLLAEQGVGRANTVAVAGITGANEGAREMYSVLGHKDPTAFRRAARRFDGTMRDVGSSVEDFHRVAAWGTGMASTRGDVYGARAFVMMRHGDYSDLTTAEQYIKDVVPFYKWMRTNVPYQLRMLAENPSQLTLVHDKLKRWAFEAQGLDYQQAQLQMPDYMRETLTVPIPSWVPVVGSKDKDALKFAMFDLPYADLYNGLDEYMSSALPVARNVLESYGFKQTLFSGTPLTGSYKPLSGVFNIPGIRDILNAAHLTRRGPDGTEYIDDRIQNVLMAWPIFSRFRNFTESDPARVDARTGGLFSMMAGVGVKAGSYTNAELDFFYNEVQPLLDQYKSLGIQLPTVDDFQSGSVGAHMGLFGAQPDVQSPLLGQAA